MKNHTLWSLVMRNRFKVIDGSAFAVLTCFAAFTAIELDLFAHRGDTATRNEITFHEMLILGAVFCVGMTIFALRRQVEARRENRWRVAAESEVRTLAFRDVLTGLPNRRSFQDALQFAVDTPPHAGGSHIVLLMDLNGFKHVNDNFGHPIGDEILVQIAARLDRAIRDGDLVARLGGDEFAVLASHTTGVEAAAGLSGRIMDAFSEPITTSRGEQSLGVAIGIALTPQDGSIGSELLRKADIALYRAKEQKPRGLSAARFFEPTMDAQAAERNQLERELRAAVADSLIRPFYQPFVALDGTGIAGFEALARWTSLQLGDISPSRFITVAEDTGLIHDLTRSLMEQACADASRWPDDVMLAFNISGLSLQNPAFGLMVIQVLARTGIAPRRLELEITESALVRDLDAARSTLEGLRGMGIRIVLDDFGTGYSSLYHLRALKPDKIKIDRSFIEGMERDRDNAVIVQALIGLGSGLGAIVTAEGVETAEQYGMLKSRGCDQGQGYYFSAAIDADTALAMVDRNSLACIHGRTPKSCH